MQKTRTCVYTTYICSKNIRAHKHGPDGCFKNCVTSIQACFFFLAAYGKPRDYRSSVYNYVYTYYIYICIYVYIYMFIYIFTFMYMPIRQPVSLFFPRNYTLIECTSFPDNSLENNEGS